MLELSDRARNAIADVMSELIDAGQGSGRIELLAADGRVLAVLHFADPSAPPAKGATLTFHPIHEDGSARATGTATKARITDSDGDEVFRCDVTDLKGDGVIKLNTTSIVAGGPVRLTSFTMVVP